MRDEHQARNAELELENPNNLARWRSPVTLSAAACKSVER